ncbi:MAG: HAMP domain-containing histidine kinase [Defluviitaleaceae bacterium]|nr:HAMP domain-containing histidine kinase [Defluviitaleaceae bacterium]
MKTRIDKTGRIGRIGKIGEIDKVGKISKIANIANITKTKALDIKVKMRTRILLNYAVLLLSTFLLVMIIFNVAASQYISNTAIAQLNFGNIAISDTYPLQIDENIPVSFSSSLNSYRIYASTFPLRRVNGQFYRHNPNSEVIEILEKINENYFTIYDLQNRRIQTMHGVYYVSMHLSTSIIYTEPFYWLIYVDVTGLSQFVNTVNMFIISIMLTMCFIALCVAYFLARSITQPIKNLQKLSQDIGNGNFVPKNLHLKDLELENLNNSLNKTAKKLGIYDESQKFFFQNVSHELRTPIMSVKCYAEGIFYDVMQPKEASGIILEEADRLATLVEDILYISRIDNITSSYSQTMVNLSEIIHKCILQQKPMADSNNIKFNFGKFDTTIEYICVADLIARVISNLISNAIRYAKSTITFTCYRADEKIIIKVQDDGIGLDAANIHRVFDRFYKGKGGHHGIGLAIVKAIIDQHNAIITAENTAGGGALFTIVFSEENSDVLER